MSDKFHFLDTHYSDGLLTITLRRPPLNVLNMALFDELSRVLAVAAEDASLRLLLLTGEGTKFFSAGVDIAEHEAAQVADMLAAFHGVVRRLRDFPLPTVAALNGSALGGGLELVLACDLRVAAADALLGQPEIRLGVFAPVAAILLPRLLPSALAHELLFSGGTLTADEARHYGLLNRVFPAAQFAAGLAAFVQPLCVLSRAAQMQNKRAIRAAEGMAFDAALVALERRYLDELMATRDAHEGIAAFLDKRAPCWTHR
ncbi:MAG: enoyl-CoA hydratase/isomerase family protein [Sterolibacterium sp.]|jgi:cyclohexa-1,5-dienecarbonyl-CoA hydratase|nr:enoyl-CoA hydratase/isomerase family protein [Sterolibacterium sp.]MBP9798627.1 enoyl-CoA hydratase/isomerase family protein [Sterolibacterium sp.]